MITYKIHFIRHGITAANEQGLYAGRRTDLPLCAQGIHRLEALREHCGYPDAQKVYVSPMKRCRETAELLYPDVWTVAMDGLAECDFGEFDGRAVSELKTDEHFEAWVAAGLRDAPLGGESAAELEERASAALEAIFSDMMSKKLSSCSVVTHGGIIALLLAKYAHPHENGEGLFRWMAEDGCGWTVLMTPQMWMRDGGFEVYEKLPYRADAFLQLGPEKFRQGLEEWKREKEGEDL